ncbi:MAG TPA: hypothetical protein VK858_03690 [Longimicrobiales bacterium]|nr:hypothetical protein [Longimicrobiales bacterium]
MLELGGVGGHASLPVQALAFGAVPGDVTATVNGGAPVPVDLVETRPGFWEGRVQLASGVGEVVALRLAYGVPEALRAAPGAGDGAGELALPWVLVPWAPEDGAPDRVRVRVGFNGPVRLAAAFPAGLRAEPPGSRADAAEWWGSSLAVLPALVRARVEGLPAPAVGSVLAGDASGPGSGGPPPMPAPGFVFSGLFLAFGLVVAAYLAWMIRHERRA